MRKWPCPKDPGVNSLAKEVMQQQLHFAAVPDRVHTTKQHLQNRALKGTFQIIPAYKESASK